MSKIKGQKYSDEAERYRENGLIKEAIDSYEKAINTNHGFASAYYNLAVLYQQIGHMNKAVVNFKRVIELCPYEASAHNNIGVIFFSLGQFNEAKEYFEQALSIETDYQDARNNLIKVKKKLSEQQTSNSVAKNQITIKILYINVIECNAGWGAEYFVDKGFRRLGYTTHCIDYRKYRDELYEIFRNLPEHDVFFLQRGDYFPIDIIKEIRVPKLFWASELVSRCRDQDRLLSSGLFDHIFFRTKMCINIASNNGWIDKKNSSILLSGFDETIHRSTKGIKQDIDILFVGTLTSRRKYILNKLQSKFRVTIVNAFGEDLVNYFNRSKIVLNIHAEDYKDTETRVFEVLGSGSFLLTERLSEENPFINNKHIIEFSDYDELCAKAEFFLKHDEERNTISRHGYEEAIKHNTYTHRAGEIAEKMLDLISKKDENNLFDHPKTISTTITAVQDKLTNEQNNAYCLKKSPHLRIFAAYRQVNWEDHNILPALDTFGEVIRFKEIDSCDQYHSQWHYGGKQQMNMALLKQVQEAHKEKNIDVFFSYLSGRWVFPAIIRAIRMLGIPTLNICLDDRTKFYSTLEPTGFAGRADIASAFTLCWTSTEDAIKLYESVNAKAIYLPEGANPDVYKPVNVSKDIDVSFVGQYYGQRPSVIEYMRNRGVDVQTFGRGWPSGEIPVEDMVLMYNRSRINLGFAAVGESKDIYCLKGRDFEIPMSGGLYFTQYHSELENVYDIGREIVCYKNIDDLIEKIQYYLAHPQEAEDIRQAGLRRSQNEHTWEHRFEKAFTVLGVRGF